MRGRIDSMKADDNGKVDKLQQDVLQNLAGKDSILGRAISIWSSGEKLACCVVAHDASPQEDEDMKLEAERQQKLEEERIAAEIERERQAKLEAERWAAEKKAEEARYRKMTKSFAQKFEDNSGTNAGAGFQQSQFGMPL